MEIYNPYLNRYEKYSYKHTRETEIYNNQMYKTKDSVKKNILCHDIYNSSQIEERIQKGELPNFTSSSLERNFYGDNGITTIMAVNDTLITKEIWLDIFKNPSNPLTKSFIESLKPNHWSHLSRIDEAVPLLALHLDKVDWANLTRNNNPDVIPILENNWEKVDKMFFCTNPNVLPLLEKYPEKIRWWIYFGWNLNIYEPDYENIQKRMNIFKEELLTAAFHPNRVAKMIEYAKDDPGSFDFLFLEKWASIFTEELMATVFHPRRIQRLIEIVGEDYDFDSLI